MKEAKVAKQQKRAVTEQKTVENVYPISEKIHINEEKKEMAERGRTFTFYTQNRKRVREKKSGRHHH